MREERQVLAIIDTLFSNFYHSDVCDDSQFLYHRA